MNPGKLDRRQVLQALSVVPAGLLLSSCGFGLAEEQSEKQIPFKTHHWIRDARNPILPPKESFDQNRCMNPFAVRNGDQYFLFYSGADKNRTQRICLATSAVDDLANWKRVGPLFDVGQAGNFDELWCVLPCVHRFGDRWHLYYTGREKSNLGLQSFPGIGLAVSDDLLNWKKYSDEPVLKGDGFERWPNNRGIAGGGSLLQLPQADGKILYRMHYTLATGTPSKDLLVDQAKYSVTADSWDGIEWFNKQVALGPRPDAAYEDAATIALTLIPGGPDWRAIYAGIGSQFGAYSICEAISRDGIHWERGQPGENLSLPPAGSGWESKMTTYPNVVAEGDKLRLFYCGNGYGATGIGTAIAEPLQPLKS